MALTPLERVLRHKAKYPERVKASHRATYQRYKEKWLAQGKAYKEEHKEHYKDLDRMANLRRKLDPVRLEQRRKQQREYYQRNREKRIVAVKEYGERNKVVVQRHKRVRTARRRARKLFAAGFCSFSQWVARFEFYGGQCAYCGENLTLDTVHREHVIPMSQGGSEWPANLVPACPPCNLSKHVKRWSPRIAWATIKES